MDAVVLECVTYSKGKTRRILFYNLQKKSKIPEIKECVRHHKYINTG